MIQQHTITTTPKYNFPQPTMDTALPQRLIELSIHTLKHVHPQTFQLDQQALQLKMQPIPLKPRHEETIVTAVDTSTTKIGETTAGTIVAIRAANVWKQNRTYRYIRLGPFTLHITETNKHELYNTLKTAYSNTPSECSYQNSPNLEQMPTRTANLLEKWLQAMLAKTASNSLILFDGSLTSGTPDTPTQSLKETLNTARKHGNTVLAFSKITTLRFNGYLITDMAPTHKPPHLLEIAGLKPKPPIALLGDVYVARLTKGNYAFRLDIDKELPFEKRIEAMEKLLGNDIIQQSYPETLRLAHILCTFTANEVIAIQHYITHKHKLKLIKRPNMHRLLFGPYGKGDTPT